jgi:hypothetical protein
LHVAGCGASAATTEEQATAECAAIRDSAPDEGLAADHAGSGPVDVRAFALASNPGIDSLRLATDAGGNTVIAGTFSGTIDFGGASSLKSTGNGKDLFAAKFDGGPHLLWQQRFGGAGDERLAGLAVGGASIYLTGTLSQRDEVDLGTGPLPVPTGYTRRFFVLSLDPAGHPRWTRQYVSDVDDMTRLGPLAAYAQGDLILTGRREGSGLVDFGRWPVEEGGNWFIVRLGSDGAPRFGRALRLSYEGEIGSVAPEPDGAVLLTVRSKSVGYEGGFERSGRGMAGYTVKMGPAGEFVWVRLAQTATGSAAAPPPTSTPAGPTTQPPAPPTSGFPEPSSIPAARP